MNANGEQAAILARAQRLVELYQSRIITSLSLIDQVADLVTPENVEEVTGLLPPEVKTQLGEWARRLPMPNAPGMVCWPLPEKTTLSFKEWLKRREAEECANHGGCSVCPHRRHLSHRRRR